MKLLGVLLEIFHNYANGLAVLYPSSWEAEERPPLGVLIYQIRIRDPLDQTEAVADSIAIFNIAWNVSLIIHK